MDKFEERETEKIRPRKKKSRTLFEQEDYLLQA